MLRRLVRVREVLGQLLAPSKQPVLELEDLVRVWERRPLGKVIDATGKR